MTLNRLAFPEEAVQLACILHEEHDLHAWQCRYLPGHLDFFLSKTTEHALKTPLQSLDIHTRQSTRPCRVHQGSNRRECISLEACSGGSLLVLQCLPHLPQVDFALGTSESAVKVRNLGQSWGMCGIIVIP